MAVVDVRLPPSYTDEGLRAALAARRQIPGLPVLVLSQHVERAEMAGGRSNTAIQQKLFLSESAVSKHIASIFGKLGLAASDDDNRRVLAVLAYLNT